MCPGSLWDQVNAQEMLVIDNDGNRQAVKAMVQCQWSLTLEWEKKKFSGYANLHNHTPVWVKGCVSSKALVLLRIQAKEHGPCHGCYLILWVSSFLISLLFSQPVPLGKGELGSMRMVGTMVGP